MLNGLAGRCEAAQHCKSYRLSTYSGSRRDLSNPKLLVTLSHSLRTLFVPLCITQRVQSMCLAVAIEKRSVVKLLPILRLTTRHKLFDT